MDIKTHCIVLRTVKYGDNKLIIDLLTRDSGRMSIAWKITTSRTSKIKKQFFQPLSILEMDLHQQPHQQMATIKDARVVAPYTSIPFDGIKLSVVFFIAEFLCFVTRSMHADKQLYDFVEQSLIWLDSVDASSEFSTSGKKFSTGIANFHLMFMIRMSVFLGFQPDSSSYTDNAYFDLREGFFCSSAPMHSDYLQPDDAKKMQTLMRMTPSNLHLFAMSRSDRNRVIDIIITYYRLHIPAFGDMKTLEILRSL